MKAGDVVRLQAADGTGQNATVSAVVGAGASDYKRLDVVTVGGERFADIAHSGDQAEGDACWLLLEEVAPVAAPPATAPDTDAPPYWQPTDEDSSE